MAQRNARSLMAVNLPLVLVALVAPDACVILQDRGVARGHVSRSRSLAARSRLQCSNLALFYLPVVLSMFALGHWQSAAMKARRMTLLP